MALTPGLASFLKSLKTNPIDTSIDNLISCVAPSIVLCRHPTRLIFLPRLYQTVEATTDSKLEIMRNGDGLPSPSCYFCLSNYGCWQVD